MSKKRNKAKPKVKSFQITTDFGASFIPIDTDKKIAETVLWVFFFNQLNLIKFIND